MVNPKKYGYYVEISAIDATPTVIEEAKELMRKNVIDSIKADGDSPERYNITFRYYPPNPLGMAELHIRATEVE
jgi:hypothetical protein